MFAASYLFAGVAALALVSSVGTFFAVPEFSHRRSEEAADGAAGDLAAYGLTGFAVSTIVFGGVCLLLSLLDGRGRQGARVTTWGVGGLSVCFNVALLTVDFYDSVPWYGDMTRTVAVGMLLLTLGSVTLLALPASHAYFRAAPSARRSERPPSAPPAIPPPPGHPPAPISQSPPPRHLPPPSHLPPPGHLPPSPSQPPPPLQGARRPVAVTAAMAVLVGIAVVTLVAAVVEIRTYQAVLSWLDDYRRTMEEQTAQYGIDVAFPQLPATAAGPTVILVVALVAVAALLIGLALAIRLPRPRARITVLVTTALFAALAMGRALLTAVSQATISRLTEESQRLKESVGAGQYQDPFPSFTEIYPQWAPQAVYLTTALAVLGYIAVFVLLILRGSNAWFAAAGDRAHRYAPPPPYLGEGYGQYPGR
ncbi:hypothetical protein GQS52_03300 [Streptomyces sp. SCUT-3]|uniref:hypothetical protein n=1 Tax=Streptomyces sp. SCUT-3 TaxID=2684469 RepID=UPI000CBABE50|nr:hypothetical protein [Streptomyces sp. SCUT-3]PLW71435.1 hypothetical protein C0036_17875 [Streptomyces sp. DJ]QMV20969.1 hypothetical protein GQS52_03300 [Streptomyces sp. SCUT-3]